MRQDDVKKLQLSQCDHYFFCQKSHSRDLRPVECPDPECDPERISVAERDLDVAVVEEALLAGQDVVGEVLGQLEGEKKRGKLIRLMDGNLYVTRRESISNFWGSFGKEKVFSKDDFCANCSVQRASWRQSGKLRPARSPKK